MDKLFELGFSEEDLKGMLEQVSSIIDMSNEEVNTKIEILTYVGCTERHIRNILISNPYYLERISDDILRLIKYLMDIGFSNLNLLFDSNPYFLNYDVFEIRDYINEQVSDGIDLEDIIDKIEINPYIIDEE